MATPSAGPRKRRWSDRRAAIGCLVAVIAASPAGAGRPLDTDDAAIIPRYACQVETFATRVVGPGATRTNDLGIAPSCNPFGSGEFLLGFVRGGVGDVGASSIGGLQYKGLLRPIADGLPGIGYVGAYSADLADRAGDSTNRSVYAGLVASAALTSALQVDANLGGLREIGTMDGRRSRFLVWRLAGEWALSPRWTVVGEHSKTVALDRTVRIGLVFAATRDLALDVSGGRRCQSACNATFYSLGLTWAGDVLQRPSP